MFLPMFLLAMLITVGDQSAPRAAQKPAADFVTEIALFSRIHVMSCHEISLLWYPVKYITPPQRSAQLLNQVIYFISLSPDPVCPRAVCVHLHTYSRSNICCAVKFYFQLPSSASEHC